MVRASLHIEIAGDVPIARAEQLALAPAPLPDHRHHHALDPGDVLAAERGRGEHVHQRIDVQVVLLGVHGEVGEAGGDGIVAARDADVEIHDIAGMGDPLGAGHELVVDAVAK